MSILSLLTDKEAAGTGVAKPHGAPFTRINEIIAKLNAHDVTIVRPTIAVADVAGSADTTLALSLADLAGDAVTKACIVVIVASGTQYAGGQALSSTITFGTAVKGTILATGNGYAIVKTDANGEFTCTASNSADETAYISVKTADGVDVLASGVVVAPGVEDDATWSA